MEGRGLGISPQGHVPPRWEWGGVRSSSCRGELRKAAKSNLPQAHTLRGSIPGAEDGREPPRPGGPWSKPFTALGTRDSPVRGGAARAGQDRALLALPSTSNPEPAPPSSLPGAGHGSTGMGPGSRGAQPSSSRSWHILAQVTVTVPGVAPEPEPDNGAVQGQSIPRGWPLLPLPLCPCPSGLEHGRGHTHTRLSSVTELSLCLPSPHRAAGEAPGASTAQDPSTGSPFPSPCLPVGAAAFPSVL